MPECKLGACILITMKTDPEVPNCYYRVSIKALITNEAGELLVVNERGRGWDLPGGGLDWGEDTIEALHREIEEELGCQATINKQPIMIMPANNNSYNQHVIWIVYRVRIDTRTIQSTDDVTEYRFMSVSDFQTFENEFSKGQWESPIDFWGELQALIER